MKKFNIETGRNAITVEGFIKEQNESITNIMKQLVETYEERAGKNEKRVFESKAKAASNSGSPALMSIAGASATKQATVEDIKKEGGDISSHYTIGNEACVGYAYALVTKLEKAWEPSKRDGRLENYFQTIEFKLDDESKFIWKKFISQRPIGTEKYEISRKKVTGEEEIEGLFTEDIVGEKKFIIFETAVAQQMSGCFEIVYYTNTDILQMYDAETIVEL